MASLFIILNDIKCCPRNTDKLQEHKLKVKPSLVALQTYFMYLRVGTNTEKTGLTLWVSWPVDTDLVKSGGFASKPAVLVVRKLLFTEDDGGGVSWSQNCLLCVAVKLQGIGSAWCWIIWLFYMEGQCLCLPFMHTHSLLLSRLILVSVCQIAQSSNDVVKTWTLSWI